jgi:hypothetical protein
MFQAITIISLSAISVVLFFLSAKFWLTGWRKKSSGTAHGLFLTSSFLFWVALFKIIDVVQKLVRGADYDCLFGLVSATFIMMVGVVQFSLSRGYFNYKER